MIPTIRAARHRGLAALGVVLACAVLIAPLLGQQPRRPRPKPGDDGPAAEPAKTNNRPAPIEAYFRDGSMLKLTLREELVEITTPYGRLVIPVAEIHRIDFGLHCDAATAKRLETAIAALASADSKEHEAAEAALLDLGEYALPALTEASKAKDADLAQRADAILSKLREKLPTESLERSANDVVETADSVVTGHISAEMFKVKTSQFGDQQVKLGDLACLGPKKVVEAEAIYTNQQPFGGPGVPGGAFPGGAVPGGFRPGGRIRGGGGGPAGGGLPGPGGLRGPGAAAQGADAAPAAPAAVPKPPDR